MSPPRWPQCSHCSWQNYNVISLFLHRRAIPHSSKEVGGKYFLRNLFFYYWIQYKIRDPTVILSLDWDVFLCACFWKSCLKTRAILTQIFEIDLDWENRRVVPKAMVIREAVMLQILWKWLMFIRLTFTSMFGRNKTENDKLPHSWI